MQQTTCTEDRIQHALDRCLDGLRQSPTAAHDWKVLMCAAGQSMNRWSLEELVKRDPDNFIILLQQLLKKTKEVQEQCQYELVAPLAIMFFSTLLQTPHCPPDTDLLHKAVEVFREFLTWPEPYSSVCKSLLSALQLEIKVPGISFQRLVREEQGVGSSGHCSKTLTVLLMNPEVPANFLTVAEQLSRVQHSQHETSITLIKHAFQSVLGAKYPLQSIHKALQDKSVAEVDKIYCALNDLLETAASLNDPEQSRALVIEGLEALRKNMEIPETNRSKRDGMLQTLPLPTAKCLMFNWDKDNFDVLNTLLDSDLAYVPSTCEAEEEDEFELDVDEETTFNLEEKEDPRLSSLTRDYRSDHRASTISSLSTASKDSMFSTLSITSESYAASLLSSGIDSDFCDDLEDYICPSPAVDKCSPKSVNKTRLSQHFHRLFRPKSPRLLYRAKSLGNSESKDLLVLREKRSNSLPQQVHLRSLETQLNSQNQTLRHVCFRRRPILSSDDDSKNATLRVVVFGADHVAGKVARAYSSLQRRESASPHLSRAFNLQFYFVPVKRDGSSPNSSEKGTSPSHDATLMETGSSTNDIAHLLGMLDPWYERNTLSLLNLPPNVVCQQTSKTESDSYDSSYEQRLPILADLLLYYCRFATRPTLIQLYQAELTFASGEKRSEVFVHSLELGHAAGTRAVKAMGTASKRFGIDGDREAVPLTLDVVYNRVVVSGRSQWKRESKVCTSVSLTKACRNPEELDSKMEYLQLSMTEVIKRQSGKSKKSFNQLSLNEVKVDKVQITGDDNTFAVCLDQDEKKILQSVTRCDISVCYKTDRSSDWTLRRPKSSAQIQPLNPSFCSLLCLPIPSLHAPEVSRGRALLTTGIKTENNTLLCSHSEWHNPKRITRLSWRSLTVACGYSVDDACISPSLRRKLFPVIGCSHSLVTPHLGLSQRPLCGACVTLTAPFLHETHYQ
uniref:Phosphoinositide 3-kinase regulatory subunit 5 n=1 Tax=Knipowitschia caucasica TaxID=637954 RepID=A0AAV2LKC9_KNICA